MTQNQEESPIHGEVTHLNPETLHTNPAFTQVITVTGPTRTIYIGGQDAVDAQGTIVGKGDLAAQTHQVLRNVRTALAAADARPEHIVKWNIYLVQGQSLQAGFTAFQQFWEISQPTDHYLASTSQSWHTRIFWWRWMPLPLFRSTAAFRKSEPGTSRRQGFGSPMAAESRRGSILPGSRLRTPLFHYLCWAASHSLIMGTCSS